MGIHTTTSIHDVCYIRAYSTRSMGAPLTFELRDKQERASGIVMFLGDQKLADALIEAINRVCREHAAHIADIYEMEHQEPEGAA
jgi:hypothetical protein